MPINVVSKGEERGKGNIRGEMQEEKIMRPRVQEGSRHDDWSDSDWVEEEGDRRGNPNSFKLHVPKLLCSSLLFTNCQSTQSFSSSLHHPSPSSPAPYFPSFAPSFLWPLHHLLLLLLFFSVWIWADLNFPPPSPSQLWITWRPGTQRLPGPPDDSQPGYNKWLTALFT